MSIYIALKFVHVLLAIVAVGFNASYGIWLSRAAREPDHELHVLRGIKILDDRFANPAYGLLLITGLAMVVVGNIPLTTFWIAAALVLWFVAINIGLFLYTPALRQQIHVLETAGADSAEFKRLSQRATVVGIATFVVVMLILYLMVFKPSL